MTIQPAFVSIIARQAPDMLMRDLSANFFPWFSSNGISCNILSGSSLCSCRSPASQKMLSLSQQLVAKEQLVHEQCCVPGALDAELPLMNACSMVVTSIHPKNVGSGLSAPSWMSSRSGLMTRGALKMRRSPSSYMHRFPLLRITYMDWMAICCLSMLSMSAR